jgi:O-antigen chain-terminating methyltransferase
MLDVSDFYRKFEDIHRGSRKLIKDRQAFYLPLIEPLQKYYPESRLIDLGCGRGEWLEVLREIGCSAQGVDQDASMLSACRELNLDVKEEDLLSFMDSLEGESCYAVTGFHIAEHLDFDQLRQLAAEAFRLVKPGGLLILETPNPENILVATSGFYMDPTHTRPIPPHLLAFVAQYAGFDLVEIIRPLASQAEQNSGKISSLLGVLNGVSPDYAILAQKKGPEILKDKILAHLSNFSSLDLPILANQYDQKIEQSLQAVRDQVDALNAQANFTEQSLTAISSQSNDDQMRLVKAETQLKERESLLRTSDQWAQELRATATAALAKVEDLQDQLEEAKDRAKDFEQRAALAGEKITGLELKSVTAETQLKERESLLRTSDQWAQELRATATAALAKVEDLQGQLEEAKDRAKDFEQRAALAGEKITGLELKSVTAETQLKERESLLRTSDQWAQELRATATAALAKVEDLQDQLEEAKDRAKDFEQRAALAGEKITGLELKSVTAETQLKERESLLRTSDQWAQELRATATAALAKVEDLQGQLEEAKDRAKDFEQRAALAGEKITGLELKSVTAETQLKERESLLRTSDQWAQELRATATAALAKVEDLQGQLEERELLLHASEQSIQELTKNLDIVSQQLLNHQAKLELEQQKNEGLEESIRSLDKDKKYLEEKISEKELLASEQTDEIRRLEITMLEIENQLKTSKEEALALEKAAEALINEIAKDQQHLQQQNIQLENLERNHKENAQLLMEAENKIATLEAKLVESQQTLYDKEQTISEQQATQARQNREAQELNQWAQELHELVLKHPAEINGYKTEIKSLKKTLSWRLTWPLRGMKRVIMFVIKQIARVPYLIGRLIHGLLVRPVLAILLWPLHKIAPLKRLVKGLVEQHPKLKRFAMKVIGRQIIAKMPVHGHEARPDEVQEQNPLLANLTPRARSIYAQLSALSEPPELQNTQGSSAYEKVEYAGELQVISSPQRMKTGEIIWIDVSVENKSATNWSAEGMHPIRLTYRWIDENENFVESEPQRTAIVTGSIKPNETFRTHLLIQAPFLAGKWTLLPTLVQEGVCWFDQQQEFENQRVTVTVGEAN